MKTELQAKLQDNIGSIPLTLRDARGFSANRRINVLFAHLNQTQNTTQRATALNQPFKGPIQNINAINNAALKHNISVSTTPTVITAEKNDIPLITAANETLNAIIEYSDRNERLFQYEVEH